MFESSWLISDNPTSGNLVLKMEIETKAFSQASFSYRTGRITTNSAFYQVYDEKSKAATYQLRWGASKHTQVYWIVFLCKFKCRSSIAVFSLWDTRYLVPGDKRISKRILFLIIISILTSEKRGKKKNIYINIADSEVSSISCRMYWKCQHWRVYLMNRFMACV